MPNPKRIVGADDWIIGLDRIAARLGCHRNTVRNWIDQHGLPVATLPDGRRFMTEQHLHQWVLARVPGIAEAIRRGQS